MGVITVRIDDALEQEFREYAYRVFGAKRGSLSRAIEEAIRLWLERVKERVTHVDWSQFEVRVSEPDATTRILRESREVDESRLESILRSLGVRRASGGDRH